MKDFKLSRLLISIHLVIFLIICFVLHFLISLPFFFLPDELFGEQDFNMVIEKTGKGMLFFGMVVIAPILETFIFQFLVIKGFQLLIKKPILAFYVSVPLSALFFSWQHSYTFAYQIATFFTGLLYATVFYFSQYRKDYPAYLIVVFFHSAWNLFAFIMKDLGY
jgi:hypothetical protein